MTPVLLAAWLFWDSQALVVSLILLAMDVRDLVEIQISRRAS
jgi:hypothetical protein